MIIGRDLRRLRRRSPGSCPHVLHLVVALVAGVLGGALWGGLAGFLKARTGAHEVITTIMLNYIALDLLGYLLGVKGFQAPASTRRSRGARGTARLPHLFGRDLRVHLGLVIALLAAVGCWWLLARSTLGFSLRAVGANPFAARTAGMGVERSYLVGHAHLRRAGRAGRRARRSSAPTRRSPATSTPGSASTRSPSRCWPRPRRRHGARRPAVRRFRAGGVVMATDTATPVGHRVGHRAGDGAVHRRAGADPGMFRLRAARRRRRRQLAKGWNG